MKLTTLILAFFLLGLNLLPCNDTVAEESCSKEMHFHTTGDADSHNDVDFCSPFCQCNCCQTVVTSNQILEIDSDLIFLAINEFRYSIKVGKENPKQMFEPPQV